MKLLRRIFERITGWKIDRFGDKSFLLIHKHERGAAWFSYACEIQSLLDNCHIDLVLDVGANEGQFARALRSVYKGPIISFEPVSSVFEKLQQASSSDPLWGAHKLALGSEETRMVINVSTNSQFSSLLEPNDYCVNRFGSGSGANKQETVCVRRLEAVLDELRINAKSIFLKMDTQGYDTEVFKGLGLKVDRVRALQTELSAIPIYDGMPHWTESIATYEKAGFQVVSMFPIHRDRGRIIETDCLLLKV